MEQQLVIRGARQHNLRGFTLSLPHRRLIVLTGPSGSGKSSLAFDTIYAEGQRRYIESLSTYAKQFLERMPRPDSDGVTGIAPAVAIEQKNPTTSSRSTVGTATELYDYLRLLWSRIGRVHCVSCGGEVRSETVQEVVDELLKPEIGNRQAAIDSRLPTPDSRSLVMAFPLPPAVKAKHELVIENLLAMGYVRVIINGQVQRIEELPKKTDLARHKSVLVVVDRIEASASNADRLAEAVATSFGEGDGIAVAVAADGSERRFSSSPRCLACNTAAPTLTPALFSFNHPRGACPGCNGFGAVLEYDERLIVCDPARTIAGGAIDPWNKPRYEGRRRTLRNAATAAGIPVNLPWKDLKAEQRRFLLHGRKGTYLGIFPFLKKLEAKRYKQYIRVFLRQYQMAMECPACHGRRLRPEALAVTVAGRTIGDAAALTAEALGAWCAALDITPHQRAIGATILVEIEQRLSVLNDVGLGYITLDRQTRTLSGGEAQRISLANALGGKLTDTLYVLDEPTIGLHPRDTDRLLSLLRRLADLGNTVLAVEHDTSAMRIADWLVELGPGAGEKGGQLVFQGTFDQILASPTLTGRYLSGERNIAVPSVRRRPGPRWISISGASANNLDNVDVAIPIGTFTVVTGVSGSGKSTLVTDVIHRQLERHFEGKHSAKEHLGEVVGTVKRITGLEAIEAAVLVDQSPIGRTPRSNPVTYVKAYDDIRELFAEQPLSKSRRYKPSTFSFNVAGGGRCDVCDGAGHVQVEMVFLADVFVPCEACGGSRFKRDVLDVKIRGYTIADVLQFTVDEAMRRFRHQDRLGRALWHLSEVGLGYLRLGQAATTLSGGEAQRLKIARELSAAGKKKGRKLYILDEPTTGLHVDDVRVLLGVLDRLVDQGNTVLVIEHHLDVIKRADWVIDMGPGAGAEGGKVVVAGTPEAVAACAASATGTYLKPLLVSRESLSRSEAEH